MKALFSLLVLMLLVSCNNSSTKVTELEQRIDSLEIRLQSSYKPGLGELMSSVQMHHSKMWFAGKNENWQLVDFEVKEINEVLDDILKFQSERKETEYLKMIQPSLDSLRIAIKQKNSKLFETSLISFTNTCNSCHKITNFEYNKVKIPDISPYSNQDFTPNK